MQVNGKCSRYLVSKYITHQRRALPLLAAGLSGIEVSKEIQVNPATLSHWQNHDPGFAEDLDVCRWEALIATQGCLCSLSRHIDTSSAMKGELAASDIGMVANTTGTLGGMMKTSACAVGVFSGTISLEAAMDIPTEMQGMLYELSTITKERAEGIAAEHGFKFEIIVSREDDKPGYSHYD